MPLLKLLYLIALLLPTAAVPAVAPLAPPWLNRCLSQLRPPALLRGAPLPTDSPRSAEYGTCAARCDARCFLLGDFDGDGRTRELAVASPTELLFFHDVERGQNRKYHATPVAKLSLSGEEVALVSEPRTQRFANEVGRLRDGKSPLPLLQKSERLAIGLLLWRSFPGPGPGSSANGPSQEDDGEDDEEHDDLRSSESGDLMVAVFDEAARTYKLARVLQLGAIPPVPSPERGAP